MSDDPKPIAIDLVPHAHLLTNSREFLRLWAAKDGPTTCFINPVPVGPDPAAFGVALVDCIRHAAKSWARATTMTEAEALERIWYGLDSERAGPNINANVNLEDDGLI